VAHSLLIIGGLTTRHESDVCARVARPISAAPSAAICLQKDTGSAWEARRIRLR
jgi:hypothetical protein